MIITNEAVLRLKSNSKAHNTKRRYNCTNYRFILWLFEHRTEYVGYIKDGFLEQLETLYQLDLTECGGNTAHMKYKNFRRKVMELLEASSPSAGNCPIDMNKVTYKLIAT